MAVNSLFGDAAMPEVKPPDNSGVRKMGVTRIAGQGKEVVVSI
jgi:hypothetical protein